MSKKTTPQNPVLKSDDFDDMESFEATMDAIESRDTAIADAPETIVTDDTCKVLTGTSLSIAFQDPSISDNVYIMTSILQGIAGSLQLQRINAEDRIADLENQAKANMDRDSDATNRPDGASLELEGLTTNQLLFMENLEDQLDAIAYAFEDLESWWDQENDNASYKLLRRSDAEVRQAFAASKAKRDERSAEEVRATIAFNKKAREQRRAERAARH